MEKNFYKILQIDFDAEQEVVQAAYRRLVLKYHPDTSQSPDALSRTQEIIAAYEVIGDPLNRTQYDRWLNEQNAEWRRAQYEGQKQEQEAEQRRVEYERRQKTQAEAQRRAQYERAKAEQEQAQHHTEDSWVESEIAKRRRPVTEPDVDAVEALIAKRRQERKQASDSELQQQADKIAAKTRMDEQLEAEIAKRRKSKKR